MPWHELVNAIRPTKVTPHIVLVLCGHAAANLRGIPGPGLDETEIITFHRARYGNDEDVTGILDVVRLVPDETLLKHVVIDEGQYIAIIAVDWLSDTSQWPSILEESLRSVPKNSKIILTAVNYEQAMKTWRSSAVLGERVDACHQLLRVVALKNAATLVYSINSKDAPIDWLAVVSRISGILFTSRPSPDEQLVADPVFAVYAGNSTDNKEKILALNPSFDFDLAMSGELKLAPLVDPVPSGSNAKELSFDSILAEFDEKTQSTNRLSEDTAAESHRLVYDGIGTGVSEDRKVISEFFTKIAQRSS